MDKLNIEHILKKDNNFPEKIGELTHNVIDILNLNLCPKNITIYPERIYHCETNHKKDFVSEESFIESLESIPEIISSPDYVGFHEIQNSIIYVKKIKERTAVAIKITTNKILQFRTMYPISEYKLKHFLNTGRLYPVIKKEHKN